MFNFCRIWIGLKKGESSKIRIDKSYLVKSTTVFDFPLWSGWQSTFLGLFIGPAWIFSGSHHICSQPDAASTPWSWILANTNRNTQQIHQNLSTCSFTGGTALYARHQFTRHRMGQNYAHVSKTSKSYVWQSEPSSVCAWGPHMYCCVCSTVKSKWGSFLWREL